MFNFPKNRQGAKLLSFGFFVLLSQSLNAFPSASGSGMAGGGIGIGPISVGMGAAASGEIGQYSEYDRDRRYADPTEFRKAIFNSDTSAKLGQKSILESELQDLVLTRKTDLNTFQNILENKLIKIPNPFDSLGFNDKKKEYIASVYVMPRLMALLDVIKKNLDKESEEISKDKKRAEEKASITVDKDRRSSLEEQHKIQDRKEFNEKLQASFKELRQSIAKAVENIDDKFYKAAEEFKSKNITPKSIQNLFESFYKSVQCASKDDIITIQKQTKEEAANNKLAQLQRKFLESIKHFVNQTDLNKIMSEALKDKQHIIIPYINHIAYSPAWEKDVQLDLVKQLNSLKDTAIRCGFGKVKDGIADSKALIPLMSLLRPFQELLYGKEENTYVGFGITRDHKIFHPHKLKFDLDKDSFELEIHPEVIKEMKEKDEWHEVGTSKFPDPSLFNSNFGLTKVRWAIACILQAPTKFWSDIRTSWDNTMKPSDIPNFLWTITSRVTLLIPVTVAYTILLFLAAIESIFGLN